MRTLAQLGVFACGVVGAAAIGLTPSTAHACTGWVCTPNLYFPAEGTVPANLPGFYWWPARAATEWEDAGTWDDASDLPRLLRFARIDGSSPEWLEVELHEPEQSDGPYLVVPKEPLVDGGEYVLWDATACWQPYDLDSPPSEEQWLSRSDSGWPSGLAHVRATAEAPLPDELGTLNAAEPTIGPVTVPDGTSCSLRLDAPYVELSVAHDEGARPWLDVLYYATEVDDEAYAPYGDYNQRWFGFDFEPGTSFVGRARDHVYTSCEESREEGVAEGAHRARIRATIPGTELRLETNEVRFTLGCPEPTEGTDAGSVDAGTQVSRDAAIDDMDASVDAGPRKRNDAAPVRGHDEGCAVASAGPGSAPWPLALALAWLARRRARLG